MSFNPHRDGHIIWSYWHLRAANAIDKARRARHVQWVNDQKEEFPCENCRLHLVDNLESIPVEPYANTNIGLFYHSWLLHDTVNKQLKKPASQCLTFDEAFAKYFPNQADTTNGSQESLIASYQEQGRKVHPVSHGASQPFQGQPNSQGSYQGRPNNQPTYQSQPTNQGQPTNQQLHQGQSPYQGQPNNQGSYQFQGQTPQYPQARGRPSQQSANNPRPARGFQNAYEQQPQEQIVDRPEQGYDPSIGIYGNYSDGMGYQGAIPPNQAQTNGWSAVGQRSERPPQQRDIHVRYPPQQQTNAQFQQASLKGSGSQRARMAVPERSAVQAVGYQTSEEQPRYMASAYNRGSEQSDDEGSYVVETPNETSSVPVTGACKTCGGIHRVENSKVDYDEYRESQRKKFLPKN